MADDKWVGVMEERVNNLPKRSDLDAVRNEALTAIEKLSFSVEKALEKHERTTIENLRTEVTKTVEAAFKLQQSQLEVFITQKLPEKSKTDWKPYLMLGGFVFIAGVERAAPYLMRIVSGG